MRRLLPLMLVLAACGGAATSVTDQPDGTDPASPATTVEQQSDVGTTQADDSSASTESDATTSTDSGRPTAPDFTLELADGGTYTLSEGTKPVFMVFWAEW